MIRKKFAGKRLTGNYNFHAKWTTAFIGAQLK